MPRCPHNTYTVPQHTRRYEVRGAGDNGKGRGLLFYRVRGLPLEDPLAWAARRGCNGSATCEVKVNRPTASGTRH